MKIYIIWLIGVILWNFRFPNAIPIADFIVAILLSFLSIGFKKYFYPLGDGPLKVSKIPGDANEMTLRQAFEARKIYKEIGDVKEAR